MKSYIRVTLSIKIGECFTFLLFPLLFPSLQWPRPASSIKNHLFWWRSIVMWVTTCMAPAILSLSLRISWRFFVPRIFLSDVCASSLQENGLLIKVSELFSKNLLRAVMRVLHVCHAHDGVGHAVVDHGVYWHRHAVLCQQLQCGEMRRPKTNNKLSGYLLWRNTECNGAEINLFVGFNTG